MSNICLVIKCLSPDGACKGYTAARGTRCGENKVFIMIRKSPIALSVMKCFILIYRLKF